MHELRGHPLGENFTFAWRGHLLQSLRTKAYPLAHGAHIERFKAGIL